MQDIREYNCRNKGGGRTHHRPHPTITITHERHIDLEQRTKQILKQRTMPPRTDDPPLPPSGDEAAAHDASAAYLSHWIEDAQHHDHPPLPRKPHCRRRKSIDGLPRDLPSIPFGTGRDSPASPQCVGQRHGFGLDDGTNQTASSLRPPLSSSHYYARRHSDEGRQLPAGHGHGGNFDDSASSFRSAFAASQRQHQNPATGSRKAHSFRVRRRYTTGDKDAGIARPKSKSEYGTRSSRRRPRSSGNAAVENRTQEAGYHPAPTGGVNVEDHRDHLDIEAMRRDSLRSHATISTGCTGGTLSPIPYVRNHRADGAVKSILKPSTSPPPVSRHYRPGRDHDGGAGTVPAAAARERQPMILPDRTLGDAATSSDVLYPLPSDPFRALRVHDFVWLRRTNGCWTYAIFSDFRTVRGKDAMRFVTDFRGSTKTLSGNRLGKNLRLVDYPSADAKADGSVGTGAGSVPSDAAVTSLLNDLGNLDLDERGRERRRGRGDATCGTWTVDPSAY